MRKPYYRTAERRERLLSEARSWVGTPFRENAAVKGPTGGVECRHFQHECHVAAGACPRFHMDVMPVEVVRHWHEHHAVSQILSWLNAPELRGLVMRVDEEDAPAIGDITIIETQRAAHHVGLWCGHEVLHVAIPAGVVSHSTHDPDFMRLVKCHYRLMEDVAE
ncbi:hypothetical protein [Actomonas aquatica]|uniref:NlpC/P60 domain-containing protein n=1 Tax=Actomonas aquatica TaxID=2866162 RepID=A0ABZ1CDC6_9BACT|nr:hypothetical protein [Opitutus sp. WL0086]WRQ89416.1 hypothetical protein K1X11_008340 [Opitutus sp. WL0086]